MLHDRHIGPVGATGESPFSNYSRDAGYISRGLIPKPVLTSNIHEAVMVGQASRLSINGGQDETVSESPSLTKSCYEDYHFPGSQALPRNPYLPGSAR